MHRWVWLAALVAVAVAGLTAALVVWLSDGTTEGAAAQRAAYFKEEPEFFIELSAPQSVMWRPRNEPTGC